MSEIKLKTKVNVDRILQRHNKQKDCKSCRRSLSYSRFRPGCDDCVDCESSKANGKFIPARDVTDIFVGRGL